MKKFKVEIETWIQKKCTVELEAESDDAIHENVSEILEANSMEEGGLPWEYEEDGIEATRVVEIEEDEEEQEEEA